MDSVLSLTRSCLYFFFFQAEDGIRDKLVTGVQTCALPICQTKTCLDLSGDLGIAQAGLGLTFELRLADLHADHRGEAFAGGIGRASGRGRGEISGGARSLKKKKKK